MNTETIQPLWLRPVTGRSGDQKPDDVPHDLLEIAGVFSSSFHQRKRPANFEHGDITTRNMDFLGDWKSGNEERSQQTQGTTSSGVV